MLLNKYRIRWSIVAITAFAVALLFFWESGHLKIETDILESLPHNDPVLSDARRIIKHLPFQDRLIIDVGRETADRDKLAAAASLITEKLRKSGLFTKVGIDEEAKYFPELITHITDSLPLLFSAEKLEKELKPLLETDRIKETFIQNRQALEQLEGIGRSEMIAKDPLGFSGIILRQLSALMPTDKAQFHQDQLISEDGKHALIIAKIAGSGSDTATGARISRLLDDIEKALPVDAALKGEKYTLNAAGVYRAALDNETTAKKDTHAAITLTTLGIAFLLLFAFPRPLIGLLALLPSTVGAIAALFVCSFFFKSMSMIAVGFGGAIMAFTVDLGITYLLFLDQPRETSGKQVAHEVWSADLLAVLTTVGAFLLLLVSDFKILAEIGVFSALGVTFALLFVHFVFPVIFPTMPAATRPRHPFLFNLINKTSAPAKWKFIAALTFGLLMLFFARPVFNVDISSMNSVSKEAITAENVIQKTWGDLSGKCYVFLQAADIAELQEKNDQLLPLLTKDMKEGKLSSFFLPSSLFPSAKTAGDNLAAWRNFWNPGRLAKLEADINDAARAAGFAPDAFAPFWKTLHNKNPQIKEIPGKYLDFLGITKSDAGYNQLSLLATGRNYNGEDFFSRLAPTGIAGVFDVGLFNKRLGDTLRNIFLEIALITSIGIVVVVFLFFLDWMLSLIVLAPVAFALVATLGTMKIIGHPLDIPGIMLWVVIMGMGIDYSIYYVCFYQRYRDENHPSMDTIKMAMFLASFTTLIGFGVLAFARHSLLHSIGLTSLLGIGYSILGSYFILPTLMKKLYTPYAFPAGPLTPGSKEHLKRTVLRYRHLEAYPRLFARFKIKIDPMFKELDKYVQNPRRIIDIGCGYGIPAVWLLELYPAAKVYGLEPDEERVRIASRVIGERGKVETGKAPDLPPVVGEVDYVIMLDMLHYVSDEELPILLRRIYEKLEKNGTLLVRSTVPSERKVPWKRWIESFRLKHSCIPEHFRSEKEITGFIQAADFQVDVFASSTAAVEEKWFVGKRY
ncbi:MAG: MMPL family transporter [Smithella sp.]